MLLRYLEVGQNMKSPKVSDNKYLRCFVHEAAVSAYNHKWNRSVGNVKKYLVKIRVREALLIS